MSLTEYVAVAARHGASDLHLETGLPAVLRVRGELVSLDGPLTQGVPGPLGAEAMTAMVREVLEPEELARFQEQRSADLATTIAGQRCRVNVLVTSRGIGLAVRLLPSETVSLSSLNLHPDLGRLVEAEHGLVIVSGPTGCGKSSTLAALIEEINRERARHIITVEHPVEFELKPKRSFIRQREVGRDTPSFGQALLDAMREDIDVLMVGEMRDRETMQRTLDACETGHLVLTTTHSSTVVEALQRIVSAFPAPEQPSVCAQLADCLRGVIGQRLAWRDDLQMRVPECEVLVANTAVRAILRQGQFFKLVSAMETGAKSGMWTRERYRAWLESRSDWVSAPDPARDVSGSALWKESVRPVTSTPSDEVIVIEPEEGSLSDIMSELEED
jgi:twitching motility protein PilT